MDMLDVRTRREWRRWLGSHHDSSPGVWLVFHKRDSGVRGLEYEEAVEEAICHGWIDSLIKRLDHSRYARKFTPRKSGSRWSTANRRRYADLARSGMLTKAGTERPPTEHSGDAQRPDLDDVPEYILQALSRNPRALRFFEGLAPSYRRAYLGWIDSAKRQETRERRLREAIGLLAAGRKLGLK